MIDQEKYRLHEQYLNQQMVRVIRTLGFDVDFTRGEGPYLFSAQGNKYLDLLSGFGVFALGRNHPKIASALIDSINSQAANLSQFDVSAKAGELAQRLLGYMPYLEKAFFCNSGSEAVESGIKFARAATKKSKIIYCSHAFHGLTYGALSVNGDAIFKENFGPLLPETEEIPFNDLAALEEKLSKRDVAAFIVEPIQGKNVHIAKPGYLAAAKELCQRFGALLILDEIQTGMGRTGKFLAADHEGIEADMVLLSKALSGGYIPIGAVMMKKWIFDRTFDRMDKAMVHGSTFSKNELAMVAGLATLQVMEEEQVIENTARQGEALQNGLRQRISHLQFIADIRGRGLMIGIEFGQPEKFTLKAAWNLLEKAGSGLFCQLVILPLFKEHHLLVQVSGNDIPIIKLLPSLIIGNTDVESIINGFSSTVGACQNISGAIWDTGRSLAGNFIQEKRRRVV